MSYAHFILGVLLRAVCLPLTKPSLQGKDNLSGRQPHLNQICMPGRPTVLRRKTPRKKKTDQGERFFGYYGKRAYRQGPGSESCPA